MTTVVDASFAVHLGTSLDPSPAIATQAVAAQDLLAPAVFWHEVASALRSMRLRRKVSSTLAEAALVAIAGLDVAIEAADPGLRRVSAVSDKFQLTIYDAAYLELALRTGSSLATRDGGLASAAVRAGVPLAGVETS